MDRNPILADFILSTTGSLSARRAWIEIRTKGGKVKIESVALRKESVDRNANAKNILSLGVKSLSARRAWIEINSLFRLIVS